MKLNMWQWLGVVMLVVASALWVNNKLTERKEAEMGKPAAPFSYEEQPTTETAPTTEPAAAPATAPS